MFGKIVGVILGAVLAALVIWVSESLIAYVGAPVGIDPTGDPAAYMRAMPAPALVGVLLSYFAAALLGGLTAARVARAAWASWVVAGLLLAWTVANVMMLPHPVWFTVAAFVLIAAGGWFGGLMGRGAPRLADEDDDEPAARPWAAPEPDPEPEPEAWPAEEPAAEEPPTPDPDRPRWTPLPPRRDEE